MLLTFWRLPKVARFGHFYILPTGRGNLRTDTFPIFIPTQSLDQTPGVCAGWFASSKLTSWRSHFNGRLPVNWLLRKCYRPQLHFPGKALSVARDSQNYFRAEQASDGRLDYVAHVELVCNACDRLKYGNKWEIMRVFVSTTILCTCPTFATPDKVTRSINCTAFMRVCKHKHIPSC